MNKRKIIKDMDKARGKTDYLGRNQDKNFQVAVQNYLEPYYFTSRVLPINHS